MQGDPTYWSTVVQTATIFALALTIEVRQSARRWTAERKAQRRVESIAYMVNGAILFTTFSVALALTTAKRATIAPVYINILLVISFALMCWQPVYYAAIRANADIFSDQSFRVRFFRKRMRATKLKLEPLKEELRRLQTIQTRVKRAAEAAVSDSRRDVTTVGLLETTAREWSDTHIGAPRASDLSHRFRMENLDALVTQYDSCPSPELASRLRRIRAWQANELASMARDTGKTIDAIAIQIKTFDAQENSDSHGRDALESLRKNLEVAGSDFVFMWPVA